jgi:outer membrane biosynthesis protein TonB
MMDASEPTSDSTETMARVPFVGRLHLYLPQFPTKSLSYFSSSGTSTSLTPPPTPPSSSEPEQELEEVEPMEDIPEEEEEEEKQAKADDQPQPEEKEEETTANNRLVTERNSQEYVALVLSWLFLVIESLLRAITTYLRE